ncbi:hypothetical protein [Rhizobium mongolense]|uniref:Uncharacterized protein n=1 Tax=Rhizobium mongolense TaxID=57676 RepID=A0A7W6RI35_9HYPH|nr:hypothetical protein [Rhizobium mongolense]MBB4272799.1 hypothetical protein [Rhizobium mongolense]
MVETSNTIWRDYVTEGVPSSGSHKPVKSQIRAWGTDLEESMAATLAVANANLTFDIKADAQAAEIPAAFDGVTIRGSATIGDGLGGDYIDTNNGSTDTFASAGATARTWYRVKDVGEGRLSDALKAKVNGPNSPITYNATGDGTTDDSTNYALAEAANDSIYLPVGKTFNLGSDVPTKPVYGPGSLKLDGREYSFQPKAFPHRSAVYAILNEPADTSWLYDSTPVGGGHANVMFGVGMFGDADLNADGSTTAASRTTLFGSLMLADPVVVDRLDGFGQGVFHWTRYGERNTQVGSLGQQWGGSDLTLDPEGTFYFHSIVYNQGGTQLVSGSPGSYTLNAGWASDNAFGLDATVGQSIVDWMNTDPWASSVEEYGYNVGMGRDSFNDIIKGLRNTGIGYRALSLLMEGDENTAVGDNALFHMVFGNYNTAIGRAAGWNHQTGDANFYAGYNAGRSHGDGTGCLYIGHQAGYGSNIHVGDWAVLIGQDAGIKADGTTEANLDNKFYLQNRYTRDPLLNGNFADRNLGVNVPVGGTIKGTFHVFTGASGSTGVGTGGDDLVIENNANVGLTLLCPNTDTATIGFGDAASSLQGWVQYVHSSDTLRLGAGGSTRVQITSAGMGFNGAAPISKPTGVAVTAAAIHAALVSYGLIAA